jgi:hypothetical protein
MSQSPDALAPSHPGRQLSAGHYQALIAIYEARAVAARARSSAGPMLSKSTLSTGFSFKFNLTPVQSPGRLRPFLSL